MCEPYLSGRAGLPFSTQEYLLTPHLKCVYQTLQNAVAQEDWNDQVSLSSKNKVRPRVLIDWIQEDVQKFSTDIKIQLIDFFFFKDSCHICKF